MRDEIKIPDHKKSLPFSDVSGVILAGGKSSRYGEDKAFVKVGGIPIIERVIRIFKGLFRDIVIISNSLEDYKHLALPLHEDLIKNLGPLGGIYTALNVILNRYCFVAACDMPSLNKDLINHMISQKSNYDIVAPKVGWKIEALHSLYSKACLPYIRNLIEVNRYQVVRIFPMVSVRYIEEEEIRFFDPELKSFLNINSPQDIDNFFGKHK
jgi:molybdopterin-guanine dinucleotide biosynthesis protein A